ncbi:hypothetical protein SMC26_06095 [Actinomadura fulvescens]|uniref:DUF998 domain-containing protein n=1 Tax=Actinomadura fulvescens TaxID=46160 RepID=A0ABP6BZ03_9ACTN
MTRESGMTGTRSMHPNRIVAGGWIAITLLFVMTLRAWPSSMSDDERPFYVSNMAWSLGTLGVVVLLGTLATVVVKDPATWHDDGAPEDRAQRIALALTLGAWLFGGLFTLNQYLFGVPFNLFADIPGEVCGGSEGAGTFGCLHRVGPVLHVLGVVFALLATPIAGILLWVASRSRLCARVSPIIIFGLYLLALRFWLPHEGWGVPNRPRLGP